MALPVLAVILIKVVAVAVAAFLAAYLISNAVRIVFSGASKAAESIGGWGNVILIGGIAYGAYAGGLIKL